MSMKRDLVISPEPIDEGALVPGRTASGGMGAAVYFAGIVRGSEGGEAIQAIDYEAFETMARHQFELIFREVESRWPVESIRPRPVLPSATG